MSRNIEKIVSTKKVNPYYDITLLDLHYLKDKAEKEGAGEAIIAAFYFGYAMGQKATKAEAKKKAKASK